MKIAVLAWSPLATDSAWRPDGPLLPIEFAKTSPQGGLIPVLCGESWVLNVRTLWVASTFDDLDGARQDFALREGVLDDVIGWVKMDANSADPVRLNSLSVANQNTNRRNEVITRLKQWGQDRSFDAVIWRDDGVDFFRHGQQGHNLQEAQDSAVQYLGTLQGDTAATAAAETCFRRVPIQIWTAIRAYIAMQCDWVPGLAATQIRTADDLRLKEWQECRKTIGRLDTILEDLRKVGFSIITGLLAASGFLNFLGVQTTQNVSAPSPGVRAAVFSAIMVLVAALFSVDTYYQVLLSGAVERALDLEVQTDPPIRVTKYLSINGTNSKTSYIILILYLVLLAAAASLDLLATGVLNPALWSLGAPFWVWVAGLGALLVVIILFYWLWTTRPDRLLLVMEGVLGVWFTLGLGWLLLLESEAAKLPGVLLWVLIVGMFLSVCMEIYWVYVAFQPGLHREKPESKRHWPEGSRKVPAP